MSTSPVLRLIEEAEGLGWTFENSHEQFVTLKGSNGRRDYCIFLNHKEGFDHALLYRGNDCLGSISTLRQLRADIRIEAGLAGEQ
jgi:hypothetical protein